MCKWIILCGALVVATAAMGARTREPARTGQDATAESRKQKLAQLDSVLVTVLRREEALQDVPQAVTAISRDELASRGAQDIAALGGITPNRPSTRPAPSARGAPG